MNNPTPPRRPWWGRLPARLSLRTLMALVLIIGGGLGWYAMRARVQRDAVTAIRRVGGTVRYDWERGKDGSVTGGMVIPVKNTDPPWPAWMVRLLAVGSRKVS